ncbi:MAG: GWxTD domain-containing protein [Ichthyobacteriaceae bacterium]|nr:GWxTD domain-containing protein [Ichthyobacteriaceae bacterium]
MHQRVIIFLITILSFIINSCSTGGGASYIDTSNINNEKQMWNPAYRAYNLSNDTTRIYFIIPTDDILYVRNPKTSLYEAKTEIKYNAVNLETNNIDDSGSVLINKNSKTIPKNPLIGYFDIKIKAEHKYVVNILLTDNQRKKNYPNLITIDKSRIGTADDFLVIDSTNNISFLNYTSNNSKLKVKSRRVKTKNIFITRYIADEGFPLPAYIVSDKIKYTPIKDTVYSIDISKPITLSKTGIYVISSEIKINNGLTLLNFHNGYPLITQKENIAPPMRYLTTDEEFMAFEIGTENEKLNTEKLWASLSTNFAKMEKLFTTYYKRVQYANIYYTSYKEGWKTDRGMIYTIYGPPSSIYKTIDKEQWMYGLQNSALPVDFEFKKTKNSLSKNNYVLVRSSNKKEIWKTAIETWRKGHVFNKKEIEKIQEQYDRRLQQRNNMMYPGMSSGRY